MPATLSDFECAIKKIQSSVSQADLKKYEEWMKEFGIFFFVSFLLMYFYVLLGSV